MAKRAAVIIFSALLLFSLVRVFSVHDSLIHFIILGRVPNTEIILNVYFIVGLMIICLALLVGWGRQLSTEFAIYKLERTQHLAKHAEATKEEEIAAAKIKHSRDLAGQLEVEEFDLISL